MSENWKDKRHIGRGVAWSSVELWGRQILSFGVYAGLARILDPASFGIVALAAIYVAFTELFVSQGFGTAIIQREHLEKEHIDSSFWIGVIVALVCCGLTIALAGPVGWLFGEVRLAPVLRVLSPLLLLISLSAIPTALLTREMEFRALAIRSLVSTTVGGAVGLAMAFAGWGVWSLVAQQLVGALFGVAVLWWAVDWRPSFSISGRHLKDIYGFAANILGNNVLWFFSQRSDQTIVGYSFGSVALGPYSLASKVVQLLKEAVGGPFQAVSLPMLARLQRDEEALTKSFFFFSEVSAFISFPVFFGLAATSDQVVPLVFGTQWVAAVPILKWLCVAGALRVVFSFTHPLMLARGRPGIYLIMFIMDTTTTVILCLVASFWSPAVVGAAIALDALLVVAVVLPLFREVLGVGLTRLFLVLMGPAVLSLLMAAAVSSIPNLLDDRLGSILTLATCVISGAALYVAMVCVFYPRLAVQGLNLLSKRFSAVSTPSPD